MGLKSWCSLNGKFIYVRMIGYIDFWLGISLFGLILFVNNW